ncbi:alpha-hydroxy acid oxidase [Xanthomonas theicola]|uniref:alpha-hydroxy acid oxidase n=1 Tax=Xanthomonas theicola TaxID=56464 RepID=UPI003610E6E1
MARRRRCGCQRYLQCERADSVRLLRLAEACGYRAIVVTVDAPVNGIRNAEQRAGFGVDAVDLRGFRMPRASAGPGQSPVFMGLLDDAPTWQDIRRLRRQTTLPLLLKGIMDGADAQHALDCGIDGIIVSHHGGRTLDTLPASLEGLPDIVQRVAGKVPVLIDGGIRHGTDVVKALALGADAVLIGRPYLYALAVAGPLGVAHLLTLLRAELEVAMTLTSRRTLDEIDAGTIRSA